MTTRAAAKRAAAAIKSINASPVIKDEVSRSPSPQDVSPPKALKRVKGSRVSKKPNAPKKVKSEDVLPHGLGNMKVIKITGPGPKSGTVAIEAELPKKENLPTNKKVKAKQNKYGLTPGRSPFPDHKMPTVEACNEVYDLLCKMHGTPAPPKVLLPSPTKSGCGEVPDLLDAILRTLLSQHTTFDNADNALRGLIKAFPPADSSPNWDVVRQSKLEDVINSIACGGLQNSKGRAIKAILDVVYERNLERRNALLKEKSTGEVADIPGAKHEDQDQKDVELAQESLLSLEYLRNLSDDEVMEQLTELPGIGVKTASCVMLFCMQRPSFAVDTHVHRHVQWLGWVPGVVTADKAFSHLEVRVPNHLKYGLHQLFIKHGKNCLRCSASTNPGTEGWDDAICPIEHLVKRKGRAKERVLKDKTVKVKSTKKTTKMRIENNDMEDSDD